MVEKCTTDFGQKEYSLCGGQTKANQVARIKLRNSIVNCNYILLYYGQIMIKIIFTFLLPKKIWHIFWPLLIEMIESLKVKVEPSGLFASFNYFVLALTRCYWRFIAKNFPSLELKSYCISTGKSEFSVTCVHGFEISVFPKQSSKCIKDTRCDRCHIQRTFAEGKMW